MKVYLRRFPLNIRAIKAKIKLPKKTQDFEYSLEELIETSALKLTPQEKIEFEVAHILLKTNVSRQFKTK